MGGVIPVLASTPQFIRDYLAAKRAAASTQFTSTPVQDQPRKNRKQRRGERRGGNRR